MKLFYNDVALHDLGDILISSQQTQGLPEDAPQRWQHVLKVKINFRQPAYEDNKSLVEEVRNALKSGQEAPLRWEDDNGTEWLDQPVKIAAVEWPENPNERGTYLQSLHITFLYFENLGQTNCLPATFQRVGLNAPVLKLGSVESFKREYDARRYHPLRPHRELATGRLTARGKFLGNPLSKVPARRAALLAELDKLHQEIRSGAEGRFKFATTNQVVRVENFVADVNQAQNVIDWSLSLTFTEFPNEAGYAQAEFSVRTREDKTEGRVFLILSGSIGASSEATAKAKLNQVRASVLVAGGNWMTLRSEFSSEQIAVEDGNSFLKLTFEEEFQKLTAALTEWSLRVSDSADFRTGLIRRTYSGHVAALSKASYDAAYQAAYQRAKALGANKHQMKLTEQITAEDPQLSVPAERLTSGGEIRVRVEFSFDYQIKGSSVFMEVASELQRQTFGTDTERVSGFIVAPDAATARNLYAQLKAGYARFLLRDEQLTERREKIAKNDGPTGATRTPPKAGTWGSSANSGETSDYTPEPSTTTATNPPSLGYGYVRQWLRLDFTFTVHRPKAPGQAAVTMRYEFDVAKDFIAREKVTTINGSIWSANGPATAGGTDTATAYLDAFLNSLSLGQRSQSKRTASRERAAVSGNVSDIFTALNFSETYFDKLTGDSAILRSEINEEIECSGARIVVQPTAAANDVFQRCGIQSGKRTISGSVTATDETVALAYIKRQRSLPLYTGTHRSGAKEELPPQISFEAESLPLQELYVRNGKYGEGIDREANFKMVRVRFRFTELYEELTLPI